MAAGLTEVALLALEVPQVLALRQLLTVTLLQPLALGVPADTLSVREGESEAEGLPVLLLLVQAVLLPVRESEVLREGLLLPVRVGYTVVERLTEGEQPALELADWEPVAPELVLWQGEALVLGLCATVVEADTHNEVVIERVGLERGEELPLVV